MCFLKTDCCRQNVIVSLRHKLKAVEFFGETLVYVVHNLLSKILDRNLHGIVENLYRQQLTNLICLFVIASFLSSNVSKSASKLLVKVIMFP